MIKKYIAGLFLLFSIYGYSQQNKNKIMVGGNIHARFANFKTNETTTSVSSTSKNSSNYNDVNLKIGYFLSDRFAIGVVGGASILGSKDEYKGADYLANPGINITKSNSHSFYKRAGIFARYNFLSGNYKFGFTLESLASYDWNNSHNTYTSVFGPEKHSSEGDSHSTYLNIGLFPGVIYFITKRLSVESALGNISYQSYSRRDTYGNNGLPEHASQKRSGFEGGFYMTYLNMTFTYFLGGKKTE